MKKSNKLVEKVALYARLSRDDETSGDSNSIVNQKKLLEDYAKSHGLTNFVHFSDDGYTGANFDRPAWKKMVAGIESGEITHVITKDLSRIGRDYLQVGFYTEVMFKKHNIRFIAITNGVDSSKHESSEFAPFLNIMNEWYVRDTSRKITSVLRTRGMSGVPTNNHCVYGYKKDPDEPTRWVVDDEAAQVVQRIFAMSMEGKGVYQIARALAVEQVDRPSYYLAQKGCGNHQGNCNPSERYTWRGATVKSILERQEYLGHTVNFKTYKESYKDKIALKRPKEELVVFHNTHEAIIDFDTWERVQELIKTTRRGNRYGEANPLTGLLYCADCGAKMYNHRGLMGKARDWKGDPTGKPNKPRDVYTCSSYNLGVQNYGKRCSAHTVQTSAVHALVLDAIRGACQFVNTQEEEFIRQVCTDSGVYRQQRAKLLRQKIQSDETRSEELKRLIRKLYEDNVNGKLSDKIFEQMIADFEGEFDDLTQRITQTQQELDAITDETVQAERFVALVKRHAQFDTLTPALINAFVEKILVHEPVGIGYKRTQDIEIFFTFVGKIHIPDQTPPLSEEEISILEEQDRRRAKKAEYNRRYMAKRRQTLKSQQDTITA
ncbi:recombinase family protein [Bengtsoniella intestinalis]|uniref:recombinase family protein n=1 Tax=Bengtsoniella intestinalis TaxID=3073143 RepID=UPI00391F893B